MSNKDELDEIFVDKNESADKKLIVQILKPFVRIDKQGTISFLENYEKLKENKKTLVYLVCKKAMGLKKIRNCVEAANLKEISKRGLIRKKSVDNALYRDYKKILIKKDNGYIIPNYNLRKVKDILLK